MLLNLATIPAWTVAIAEAFGLGLLGLTFWHIVKSQFRPRIPVALVVVAALSLVQAEIQERGWRTSVWFIVVTSLAVALSALGKRGKLYAGYWYIQQKYGKNSKELNSYAMKIVARIIVTIAVLLVLSALLIKGAYSQGT